MCNISLFSDFFEDFLLILTFSNLTVMCLGIIFFVLEFAELLESVNLCLLPNLGHFQPLFLQILFVRLFLSLFVGLFTYILLMLSYMPLRYFMFTPFFSALRLNHLY